MCGIAGFLQSDALSDDAGVIVARMGQAIVHRGPDCSAIWLDAAAGLAFAHQRLSILDLTDTGNQPMVSPSGRYVVTYNGEIYNFAELKRQISERTDAHWCGTSDTEVLVAAFDRWGVPGALKRLNGMFAFAVWDRRDRVLTLARDRMGEKPLYYGACGQTFLFGSELKSLRAHPQFEPRLNLEALTCMLRYDYVPTPLTIWENIWKLPPGHYVEIPNGGSPIGAPVQYWSLEQSAIEGAARQFSSEQEMERDLEQLLSESVRMRMVSDVPLGAFLSGGIDSSLIVSLMQAQSTRRVQTFTIGFDENAFDEAPKAKAVAAHLGTDHTELYVTPQDALDVIPSLPRIWDEPFGDSSQIPTLLLSELSHRSVKVAISGDGADELFGGYDRYQTFDSLWRKLDRIPSVARNGVARLLRSIAGAPLVPRTAGRATKILSARESEDLYHWRVSRIENPGRLLRDPPAYNEGLSDGFGLFSFIPSVPEKMMYVDTLTYLPDDILAKVDRASMAVSLEVRAPFLDHRVVEFAWRLPASQRFLPGEGKPILRAIGRHHLPADILNQSKMGFSVPVAAWLRGPLRSWAEGFLDCARLSREGIFDPSAIRSLWSDFLVGKRRHDRLIWNVLMFQAWLNEQ